MTPPSLELKRRRTRRNVWVNNHHTPAEHVQSYHFCSKPHYTVRITQYTLLAVYVFLFCSWIFFFLLLRCATKTGMRNHIHHHHHHHHHNFFVVRCVERLTKLCHNILFYFYFTFLFFATFFFFLLVYKYKLYSPLPHDFWFFFAF